MIAVSENLKKTYPGAVIGSLAMKGARLGAEDREGLLELEKLKAGIESEIRMRFAGGGKQAIMSEPVITAYRDYYKRFGKTYHVALQLESIACKGRSIPRVSPLVQAMFMAELKNMMLTAGHDAGSLSAPLEADVAGGDESFLTMRGEEQPLKAGDMFIRDAESIISCIVYGPDQRTKITDRTSDVLFAVYAPPGIGEEKVLAHLEDIKRFVQLVYPEALAEGLNVKK